MRKSYLFFVPAFFLCLVIGCGKGGLQTVPVRGRITFAGDNPPKSGIIVFAPLSAADGFPKRSGTAAFDESGQFSAKAFEDREGLFPGTYTVTIECWQHRPSMDDADSRGRVSYIPKSYKPADVKVDAGASELEVNFDIPKK